MNLEEILANSFAENFNILPNKILLALSGGIDSMALCYLGAKFAKKNNLEFFTVTIDHKYRNNSTSEAKSLNKILKKDGINHQILTWEAGSNNEANFEAKAREARYELLKDFAHKNNIEVILTAHHFDDQIENFFIRLSRGSGIDGLASMQKLRNLDDKIKIFRPFLDVKKTELKNYLATHKKNWFEDETNQDQKFLRNQIRQLINQLEDKDLLEQRIITATKHFARAKDFLEIHSEEILAEISKENEGKIFIDLTDFKNLHPEIAYRILIKIFNKIGGKNYKPRFAKLSELHQKIINGQINKSTTFAYCLIQVKNSQLIFSKEK